MNETYSQGLDAALVDEKKEEKVVDITSAPKMKRKPFINWQVDGKDYRLKLTSSMICKLEQKYDKNLLLLITEEGIPPISVMLTVIQAAMQVYEHGITFVKVQDIYDRYIDEGGDQNKLMSDVIMPLLGVSGFFTESQMEVLTSEMKDMENDL